MSKSSEQFLTQREIEAIKEPDHYQRTQLLLHGNIYREPSRNPVFVDISNQEQDGNDNDYWNASIFSNQNPQ